MEFINETDWPAELFRSEFDNGRMFNSLLTRVRYRIKERCDLIPIKDGHDCLLDIRRETIKNEYGVIEPDSFFPRSGTDLIIIGDAVSTTGAINNIVVQLECGPYNEKLNIFGDRYWEKHPFSGDLIPTEPEYFEAIPMTYKLTFGGSATSEHGPVPYHMNPIGKGFYLKKESAINNPLPNIENSKCLIEQWHDNPKPICFAPYPANWGLRLMNIIRCNEQTNRIDFEPEKGLFDQAHPKLSGKRLLPKQEIQIKGMNIHGEIKFRIPAPSVCVEILIGNVRVIKTLLLEEILIDTKRNFVEFSYRKMFDYVFRPHQRRKTILQFIE